MHLAKFFNNNRKTTDRAKAKKNIPTIIPPC